MDERDDERPPDSEPDGPGSEESPVGEGATDRPDGALEEADHTFELPTDDATSGVAGEASGQAPAPGSAAGPPTDDATSGVPAGEEAAPERRTPSDAHPPQEEHADHRPQEQQADRPAQADDADVPGSQEPQRAIVPEAPSLPGLASRSAEPGGSAAPSDELPAEPPPEGFGALPGGDPLGLNRRRREARIIALANQKGGVGKTTTVINLGASLAELGQRVLLVDMDPQGSLGVGLGVEPHAMDATIYNLLLDDGTPLDEVLRESAVERLHLLPANIDLAAAELSLVQEVAREQSLRRVLDRLRYRYDYILIDCPPSLGLLTINALTAADGVLVPLECEYFALRGMRLLLSTIDKVRSRLNPELELEGIVATMVDTRTLHAREVLERVHEAFGDVVYKTTVNRTIRFAEAPVAGQPMLDYAPESRGTDAYRDLAREVMSRESPS